jgi:putative transposase
MSFNSYLPAKTTQMLDIRLEAGRHLYNACFGEALKRLAAMRRSEKELAAIKKKKSKLCTKMLKAARNKANYDEYSLP